MIMSRNIANRVSITISIDLAASQKDLAEHENGRTLPCLLCGQYTLGRTAKGWKTALEVGSETPCAVPNSNHCIGAGCNRIAPT